MSMSTHIVGFKAPDKKWNEMKAIWDACKRAKINVPDEVDEYFDFQEPDDSGVLVNLDQVAVRWNDGDMCSGLEIPVHSLPKDLTSIRFYNSY
jgi:hypothetical protein